MLPATIQKQPQQIPPAMLTPESAPSVVENHAQEFAPQEISHHTPSSREIEAEAYNLYLARGCQDGFDVEDWLAAEELLRHRQNA